MRWMWIFSSLILTGIGADVLPWYHQSVVYQLYPRSFQDSDGDGIGDLKGILHRVDYLSTLGIDAVWLNPIYPSPNKDFGYDISDFRGINPEYGTMEDFVQLVAALKKKGIRVVMDFVPNHSSDQHEWFNKSASGDKKYKDYYVWQPPKIINNRMVPINNWTGAFGGSMWKWHTGRNLTYLHQFAEGQPDLNYRCEALVQEMLGILEFWLEKGIAGFRMDTVTTLVEDDSWEDEPYNGGDPNMPESYTHDKTTEQPLTYKILRRFKQVLENYSNRTNTEPKIMMTESYSNDPLVLRRYYGSQDAPVTTFPFNFLSIMRMKLLNSAKDWADTLNTWYYPGLHNDSVMPAGSWAQPNFVLGNHDQHRVASRFNPEFTDILNMILLTLKGTALVYNGDELGLVDSGVRRDQGQDIQGLRAPPGQFYQKSRDPQRAPMPWDGTQNGGFTTGKPWLPLSGGYVLNNVESQQNANISHLKVFKALTQLRKNYQTLVEGTNEIINIRNCLIIFRTLEDQPTIVTIVNFSDAVEDVDLLRVRPSLPRLLNVLVKSMNYESKNMTVLSSAMRIPPLGGLVLASY